VQNKSWFAYKIMDSSSRLNYSYTTPMWSVLDLFSFHVTTHFTSRNTEKIIRKKNNQNGSNKTDSIMTPNQMTTALRAISQNIMNTKYDQITVNTKCTYVKQFYYSVTHSLCEPTVSQQWKNMLDVHVHQPVTCTVW
jgi:methyltransferase-like protein